MKDRIADELMRDDLTTQIAAAINDAILIYQKEQFRFNETFTASFRTNVGQQNYTTLSDPSFPAIASPMQVFHIAWVNITIPPAVFALERVDPQQILLNTQTGTQMGQPTLFGFSNETFMLYPIPSAGGPGQIQSYSLSSGGTNYVNGVYTNSPLAGGHGQGATANITVVAGVVTGFQLVNPGFNYQLNDQLTSFSIGPGVGFALLVTSIFVNPQGPYLITVGGHVTYAVPAADDTIGNRWMTDAERLIRSRAKYQIAQHVTRNGAMALAMSPEENAKGSLPGATWEAYRELKIEANRMQRRGVVAPMSF
jgi:hypothetical protein